MDVPEPPRFQPRNRFPEDPPAASPEDSVEAEAVVSIAEPPRSSEPTQSVFDYLSGFRLIDDTVRTSAKRLGLVGAVLLGLVILGVALSVVAVVAVGRLATPAIDQIPLGIGSQVPLPDGEYSINPTRMLILQDRCFFEGAMPTSSPVGGTIDDRDSAESKVVVVSGTSLAECGTALDVSQGEVPVTASTVFFVVRSGIASISRLELKAPAMSEVP